MKITRKELREIISEEIEVLNIRNKGQFAYIMQTIMDNPDEPISSDLIDPMFGKLILRKGQLLSDITPQSAWYIQRHYNINVDTDVDFSRPAMPKERVQMPPIELDRIATTSPGRTVSDDVQAVASSLMGYVRSGSPGLRSSIDKIEVAGRTQIAVHLVDPANRMTTDQQIACALRNLLDQKIRTNRRYAISPCGYKDKKEKYLMMIVRV